MKDLKDIKIVLYHVIKWLPFKPKRKGPTQCYNCCMYGHGYSSCNRPSVCCQCSGNHRTTVCPLKAAKDTSKIVPKCCNCFSANLDHKHPANDINCPFRAKCLKAKGNTKNGNASEKRNAQPKSSQLQKTKSMFVDAPTPPALSGTYAQAIAPKQAVNTNNCNEIPSTATQSSSSPSSQTLWSIEEVTNILFSSINKLQQCKSKLDQLSVITGLLHYACK